MSSDREYDRHRCLYQPRLPVARYPLRLGHSLLWTLGGVIALCGALCYAELGAVLPRSGGEYNFAGRIYHPAAGFVSGWISITVGFSALTAAVAIAAAKYAQSVWPGLSETAFAVVLVLLTGLSI